MDPAALGRWEPPAHWRRVVTLDAHTGGEPLRVVVEGAPDLPGDTILAKRRAMAERHDDLRRVLMWEPRGHADMYGALLTDPVTDDGHLGVLFLHNDGYSTMCGHAVVALAKLAVETGLVAATPPATEVRIDSPAGRVVATAHGDATRVERTTFRNVPSFLLDGDAAVDVEGLGRVPYDLGYGGAFYAYVDARPLGLELVPPELARLVDVGRRVKRAVEASRRVEHPAGDPDLGFLYGVVLHVPGTGGLHSRNVCVFADGEVDRSPTGTGVSGRAAVLHAKGALARGARLEIESLVGSRMTVEVVAETSVGGVPAVVPEVGGVAHVTGRHAFWVDPEDPLGGGFLLR